MYALHTHYKYNDTCDSREETCKITSGINKATCSFLEFM